MMPHTLATLCGVRKKYMDVGLITLKMVKRDVLRHFTYLKKKLFEEQGGVTTTNID